METEEISCAEFQEKAGLKRKLTGPPRLLLGKTRSPVQDEKSDAQALRKQRRDKNNGTAEEHQGNSDAECESHQVMCQSPQTAFAVEERETCTDPPEESLEAVSKSEERRVKGQHGKSGLRRSRAKATIRRMFSPALMCVRRRKQLDTKSVEDAEDSATNRAHISLEGTKDTTHELLTLSGDSFNVTEGCKAGLLKKESTRKGKRKFRVRMWPIFRRLSATSSSNQKQKKGSAGQDHDTFIEITSERSNSADDQPDYCAPEPSGDKAVAEQLKGSSEIHEDMARIHEESCPGKDLDHKEEGTDKVTLSAEVSANLSHEQVDEVCCSEQGVHKYHLSNVKGEENMNTQITETEPGGLSDSGLSDECNSEIRKKVPEDSPDISTSNMVVLNDLDKIAKCQPVIKIEDVHSSDEEVQEPMENDTLQHNTLSPLLSVNGSCHRFKVNRTVKNTLQTLDHSGNNSQFSEILLVQTAFSLVHAAITGAMEQLSAELQSNQIDQDHA